MKTEAQNTLTRILFIALLPLAFFACGDESDYLLDGGMSMDREISVPDIIFSAGDKCRMKRVQENIPRGDWVTFCVTCCLKYYPNDSTDIAGWNACLAICKDTKNPFSNVASDLDSDL